ncbi:hypothetical protein CNYM01_01182 [Colletotrichum nymphaeae SA-01]|uniref:Peptidase C14 caspase domain-containing protein n=1 Tax=Colletotrichum nymphaeae SA-01 TaxID=1460502 RepID=A0A135TZ67_9PEZI|nr:hypothetical protein CNYM01_01182 [Colletotrichum nymphaeae SA-01]
MSTLKVPRRFALLAGVDVYHQGKARFSQEGQLLSLNNLHGCVSDVDTVKEFLRRDFGLEHPLVLTSPAPSPPKSQQDKPFEDSANLPTFNNIKRNFEVIESEAEAGDLFFFHFSGHGARLEPVAASPAGRSDDPSLLTVDFCLGKPAIRGWQLNEWLRRLNKKNIQCVVTLDSCHAGGSWRGSVRTPVDWPIVPSLPSDVVAVEGVFPESHSRAIDLGTAWSINPEGFTLMAACETQEVALEVSVNNKTVGAFTRELGLYLESPTAKTMPVTYRILRDHLERQLTKQHPVVYGRDRLLFFGSTEPIPNPTIVARIERDVLHLPVGKAHGIHTTSEFTAATFYGPVFTLADVDDFTSSAWILPRLKDALFKSQNHVKPFRWSFGEQSFSVAVDCRLGNDYLQMLKTALQNRISSPVNVFELREDLSNSNLSTLRLKKRNDGGIDVLGPKSWIGYESPVRGVEPQGSTVADLATNTAVVLSHLGRFQEILNLRQRASQSCKPFDVHIHPKGLARTAPFPDEQSFIYTFQNKYDDDLFFAVLTLDPGFEIIQGFPTNDISREVVKNQQTKFQFKITVPEELKHSGTNRTIVRTIVTKGIQSSWKSLELPHIWRSGEVKLGSPHGRGMDVQEEGEWWVEDQEILTVSESYHEL